ncbi:MAG TPA: flagellar filament capping protein FliD [Geothrix sp.]|nr:flagellar filament capping protein FliD [Geothrix sp.]
MASSLSFQGVTSGLQTDALIQAIMERDGLPVQRLKDRQTLNTQRSAALNSMRLSMSSLSVSMAAFYDKLNARTVSSTDSNATFVTATATGAVGGSYEVKVANVATKGQLGPVMSGGVPTNMAVADPNAAILTSTNGSFAVQGTDGVVKAFKLTNNSLNGLRDAINASGAGVTATVVNSGSGANPYQLILTAKETGTGTTGGVVRLAAIKNEDAGTTDTTVVASLGIAAGTLTGTIASPGDLSGGLSSAGSGIAQDAVFSVNGVQLTRKTNTVKDAVDGVTFTLRKGDATNATTLTVAQDKSAATAGMQDVLTKFNALLKVYKDASTAVKGSDGEVVPGALTGDSTARSVINQVRAALNGNPDGLSASALYKSGAELGIKTAIDGTLSLDVTAFQAALDKDPDAVKRVFSFSGTSTNGNVSFSSGTSATQTGAVDFDLTYGAGGAISGSLTYNGVTYSGLSGVNGTLQGPTGSPLEGLNLAVTGSGTGTLTLSRGIGQKLQDLIAGLTSYSGTIETTRTSLDEQNKSLTQRIESGQVLLDKRKAALKAQFDMMEATLSQMRSASSSLSGI